MRRRTTLALGLVALVGLAAASRGQDPVPLYPENYKILVFKRVPE